jgi:putative component of membrane protein insertase Oxa1/YidC/SpoIIIJ protein YidD
MGPGEVGGTVLSGVGRIGPLELLSAWLIRLYQRHLSPRKGFACPHRLVHGGLSCSEYARQTILTRGVWSAYGLTRQRLKECRVAARELARRSEAENENDVGDIGTGEAETQRARRSLFPNRKNNASDSDAWCDIADLSCDAAWCGTESCHMPSCDMPHCDTPDCGNGCDCGSSSVILVVIADSLFRLR